MRVILIAIGMYTKPCSASLAFIACNWELLCNADLILLQKKAFSAQNIWCNKMNFHKINALLCRVFANWVTNN